MTPARFHEVFQAGIALSCHGKPAAWVAKSPIVKVPFLDEESVACVGETPEIAIGKLVVMAVEQAKEQLAEAREKLMRAEERWRRIEAAAVEMGNPS